MKKMDKSQRLPYRDEPWNPVAFWDAKQHSSIQVFCLDLLFNSSLAIFFPNRRANISKEGVNSDNADCFVWIKESGMRFPILGHFAPIYYLCLYWSHHVSNANRHLTWLWSSCGWWKGTSRDEATLISEEIKSAPAVLELCLSEGISK